MSSVKCTPISIVLLPDSVIVTDSLQSYTPLEIWLDHCVNCPIYAPMSLDSNLVQANLKRTVLPVPEGAVRPSFPLRVDLSPCRIYGTFDRISSSSHPKPLVLASNGQKGVPNPVNRGAGYCPHTGGGA